MNVRVGRDIAAEPSVVWNLLVDTDRWSQWGPSVAAVELTGVEQAGAELTGAGLTGAGRDDADPDGEPEERWIRSGSTGRVRTVLGMWIPFVVTDFEPGRSWGWRVAGVPATTHRVVPRERGCRVEFGVPIVAAPYALVCRAALRRIEHLALGDSRSRSRNKREPGSRS